MLNSFHNTVLRVAFFILVISFIIIAIMFYTKKNDFVYPPVTPSCPDYWQDESATVKGSKCVNKKNLGTCQNKVMNFSTTQWIGHNGMCNKKRWATGCGITWEGVTNKNHCERF
jgi:hypothetical protein